MAVKLIATDMDGTLLNSRKEMPADFIPWVKSHPQYQVVIASGRQYETLRQDFLEIADELLFIAENGGFAFAKGELLYSNPMALSDVARFLAMVEPLKNAAPIICAAKAAYMRRTKPEIEQEAGKYYKKLKFTDDLLAAAAKDVVVKVALYVEDAEAHKVYPQVDVLPPHLTPVLSGDSWIDVANAGASKGSALKAIFQKYGITPDEAMAFGDYLNDAPLLAVCTHSYCMENGHPALKAKAAHIAPSNDDDGVMQILRTL